MSLILSLSACNTVEDTSQVSKEVSVETDDPTIVIRTEDILTEAEMRALFPPTENNAQEQVIVTGSRIPQQDLAANSPVAAFALQGYYSGDVNTQYPPNTYRDVGRDQFKDFEENPVKLVAEEPVSTFSIDVDTAS